MEEKVINMVTITIDEYFELRKKAEMNHYLMDRFGILDGQIRNLEERLYKLETKVGGV